MDKHIGSRNLYILVEMAQVTGQLVSCSSALELLFLLSYLSHGSKSFPSAFYSLLLSWLKETTLTTGLLHKSPTLGVESTFQNETETTEKKLLKELRANVNSDKCQWTQSN